MFFSVGAALAEPQPAKIASDPPKVTINRICALIAESADENGLPRDFLHG